MALPLDEHFEPTQEDESLLRITVEQAAELGEGWPAKLCRSRWRAAHRLRAGLVLIAVVAGGGLATTSRPSLLKLRSSTLRALGLASLAPEEVPVRPRTFNEPDEQFSSLDKNKDGIVTVRGIQTNLETFKAGTAAKTKQLIAEEAGIDEELKTEEMTVAREEAAASLSKARDNGMTPVYRPMSPERATITELYTFGAPAPNEHGLYNAAAPGGCFPGLRVATRSRHFQAGTTTFLVRHDPVPSLLDFAYKHAMMDYVSTRMDDDSNDNVTECLYFFRNQDRLKDTPKWDNQWWLDGHMIYPGVLREHAEAPHGAPRARLAPDDLPLMSEPRRLSDTDAQLLEQSYYELTPLQKMQKSALMAHLTFLVYKKPQQIAVNAPSLGWSLVGFANAETDEGAASGLVGVNIGSDSVMSNSNVGNLVETVNTWSDGFGDHLLLLQHRTTAQCVLSFEGSGMNDIKDWFSNFNFFPTEFCGFGQTHRGFRAKLYRMLGGIDYRQTIRRQLKYCSSITVTGHSLGGAQAELFAACANNNLNSSQEGYLDSRLTSVPTAEPRHLVSWYSDKAEGSYLRNRGNKWCLDVKGTATTTYRSHVIFFDCEFPQSFARDQMWHLQSDGFVVSKLNGMCIDGNVTGDAAVKIWPCQHSSSTTYQRWNLTTNGFLKNVNSGLCIDGNMKMASCPYIDQVWRRDSRGRFVNALSGKCLSLAKTTSGDVGTGSQLNIMPCEDDNNFQRWDFADGKLRNYETGLCANARYTPGEESHPLLTLGSCSLGQWNAVRWHMTDNGVLHSDAERCLNVRGQPGMEDGAAVSMTACRPSLAATGLWGVDVRGFISNIGHAPASFAKCVDIFSADPNDEKTKMVPGTALFLDFCKITTDQKWEITPSGFIRSTIGSQKCLDIMQHKLHAATSTIPRLWIDNCIDPSDPAVFSTMKWKVQGGHIINSFSRKCLAWSEPSALRSAEELPGDRQAVVQVPCNIAGAHVTWEHRADGHFVCAKSKKCLSYAADTGGHELLTLAVCSPSEEAQRWDLLSSGFLRNKHNGKCVANFLDSDAPEQVAAKLSDCPDGGSQRWEILPSGQIRNKAAQLCLDEPLQEEEPAGDYRVTLRACNASRLQQKFDKIPGPRWIVD